MRTFVTSRNVFEGHVPKGTCFSMGEPCGNLRVGRLCLLYYMFLEDLFQILSFGSRSVQHVITLPRAFEGHVTKGIVVSTGEAVRLDLEIAPLSTHCVFLYVF